MINKLVMVIVASLVISSCGPGQFLGPTLTLTPTDTPTPTPTLTPTLTPTPMPTLTPTLTPTSTSIPGIEAPIILNNGVGIEVQNAILGDKQPGYTAKSGYVILSIEIAISGTIKNENLLVDSHITELQVIDENGEVSGVESLLEVTFSPPFKPILIFGVRSEAHAFTLSFPDGQTIDLAPILREY